MRAIELFDTLQNLIKFKPSQQMIADILGLRQTAIAGRVQRNSEFSDKEIELIERHFAIELISPAQVDDCIEIEHVHINPSCGSGTCVYDVADVTPVKLGKEIIRDILKIKDPKQLKLFIANGDSMEPIIENGDTLLIDTGNIEYSNGGVFLITINENWFIKRLRMKLNGELEVISDNSKYPIETIARNEDIEVKIKGRVIKNLSRGL